MSCQQRPLSWSQLAFHCHLSRNALWVSFAFRGLKIARKTIFVLDAIPLIAGVLFIYIFLIDIFYHIIFLGAFIAIMNYLFSSSFSSCAAFSLGSSVNPILEIGNHFFDAMIIFTITGITHFVFPVFAPSKKEPSKELCKALSILTIVTLLSLLGAQKVTGFDVLGSMRPMIACEMVYLAADYQWTQEPEGSGYDQAKRLISAWRRTP